MQQAMQPTPVVHNALPVAYPAFNQSRSQSNQQQGSGVNCQCPDGSVSQAMLSYVPDEFMESPEMAQAYLSYAYYGKGKGGHGKGKHGGKGGGKGGHGKGGKGGGHGKGGGKASAKGGGGGGSGGGSGGGGGGGQDSGGGGGGQDSGGGGGQDAGAGTDTSGQDGQGFGDGQGGGGRHGHGQGGQPGTGGGGQQPVLTCNCPDDSQMGATGAGLGAGQGGMPLPPASVPSMGPGLGPGMFNPLTNQWEAAGTMQPFGNVPGVPMGPMNMTFAAHSGQALPLIPSSEDIYEEHGMNAYPGYIMATSLAAGRVSPYQEGSNTTPFVHPPLRSRFAGRPANYG